MNIRHLRSAPLLLVAAGALALSFTGGAVAGGMITGADIKDGTVTTTDIANHSLLTRDLTPGTVATLKGVTQVGIRTGSTDVAAGDPVHETLNCPHGRYLLSASAFWASSNAAVQVAYAEALTGASFYSDPLPGDDTLRTQVICAKLG